MNAHSVARTENGKEESLAVWNVSGGDDVGACEEVETVDGDENERLHMRGLVGTDIAVHGLLLNMARPNQKQP